MWPNKGTNIKNILIAHFGRNLAVFQNVFSHKKKKKLYGIIRKRSNVNKMFQMFAEQVWRVHFESLRRKAKDVHYAFVNRFVFLSRGKYKKIKSLQAEIPLVERPPLRTKNNFSVIFKSRSENKLRLSKNDSDRSFSLRGLWRKTRLCVVWMQIDLIRLIAHSILIQFSAQIKHYPRMVVHKYDNKSNLKRKNIFFF